MQAIEPRLRPKPRGGEGQRPRGVREIRTSDAAAHPADDPLETGPRRPPPKMGAGAKRLNITRKLLTWIPATVAAPLAFFAVLWLTKGEPLPPEAAILANATVLDATSLMAAVQTAGLRGTTDIKGAIEEIRRIDTERVTIRGWAADAASASPLTVIVYAGRAHVLAATDDVKGSVARLVGLSDGATTRTSFNGTFVCARGEKLQIVAVAAGRRYSQFRSLACP